MINFIIRRLFYGFFVLLGVVVVVFFLFNVLPGDPARLTMGQRSDVATLETIRQELGLDKPLPVQFYLYLRDLSPLSILEDTPKNKEKYSYTKLFSVGKEKYFVLKFPYLRRSFQSNRSVSEILMEKLPGTIILAVTALIFATIIGIIIGVFSAVKKYSLMDNVAIVGAIMGISTPSFFAGLIISWIFGFILSKYTGLEMTGYIVRTDNLGNNYVDMKFLILPAFTLGIRPLAIIVQLTRSSMLDVLSQDYIRTAYAKGLTFYKVVAKHALRNALNPVITAVSGWLASLMAGAFFVEYIFAWQGIGYTTVMALQKQDFPVVMGSVLFVAAMFVVINILVDIMYAALDPRVRLH